jgi:hypothetical protein
MKVIYLFESSGDSVGIAAGYELDDEASKFEYPVG